MSNLEAGEANEEKAMMRVKMLKSAAGPAGAFQGGREYEVEPEVGRALVDADAAEEVARVESARLEEPVETATVDEEPEPKQAAVLSIDFASDVAAEYADEHDLTAADFDFEPSGKTGYTKADAERARRNR